MTIQTIANLHCHCEESCASRGDAAISVLKANISKFIKAQYGYVCPKKPVGALPMEGPHKRYYFFLISVVQAMGGDKFNVDLISYPKST